ncbi:hypothetical protein PILCRDRAFT_636777 [Piloderma croceum F 1598]|uniref:Uncharacterized protein n=1 Tax=Piloderma croceum (strain F 1598) TaxID=765440 RepID=A0A0C3EW80_PILCF|nr:hypothetical protein PILCRDRAFT_636777 [Piloderma croceum F 1598]
MLSMSLVRQLCAHPMLISRQVLDRHPGRQIVSCYFFPTGHNLTALLRNVGGWAGNLLWPL